MCNCQLTRLGSWVSVRLRLPSDDVLIKHTSLLGCCGGSFVCIFLPLTSKQQHQAINFQESLEKAIAGSNHHTNCTTPLPYQQKSTSYSLLSKELVIKCGNLKLYLTMVEKIIINSSSISSVGRLTLNADTKEFTMYRLQEWDLEDKTSAMNQITNPVHVNSAAWVGH